MIEWDVELCAMLFFVSALSVFPRPEPRERVVAIVMLGDLDES